MLLVLALFRLGCANWSLGKAVESLAIGEEALQIVEEFGEKGWYEKGFCFHLLDSGNYVLGRFKQAEFYVKQELEITKKLGNKRTYVNALNSLGEIMRLQGDGEKAISYFNKALTNAREVGNKTSEIMILTNMGGAMLITGDYEKAAIQM